MNSAEIYRELTTLIHDTHRASEHVGSDDETFVKEYRRLAQKIVSTGEGQTTLDEAEKIQTLTELGKQFRVLLKRRGILRDE